MSSTHTILYKCTGIIQKIRPYAEEIFGKLQSGLRSPTNHIFTIRTIIPVQKASKGWVIGKADYITI